MNAESGALSYEDLVEKLKQPGTSLVNVLPFKAFEQAHIPGSINLPLSEIPSRASQELPDREKEVVVYCGGVT